MGHCGRLRIGFMGLVSRPTNSLCEGKAHLDDPSIYRKKSVTGGYLVIITTSSDMCFSQIDVNQGTLYHYPSYISAIMVPTIHITSQVLTYKFLCLLPYRLAKLMEPPSHYLEDYPIY